MSETKIEWFSPKDKIPEIVNFLTSKTILAKINGCEYAGYYHENGFFYCIEKVTDISICNFNTTYHPPIGKDWVSEWRYLR